MPAALGELFRTTQAWKGINGSDAVEASLQPEAAAIISDPGVHGISVLLRSPHRPGGKSGVSSSFLPEKMNRHGITRKDELTPDYRVVFCHWFE